MSIKPTKNAGGVYLNDRIKTINTQAHFYNINTIRLYNRNWQWNTWNYNRKFSIIKHKHRRYLTVQVGSPIRPPIPSWLELSHPSYFSPVPFLLKVDRSTTHLCSCVLIEMDYCSLLILTYVPFLIC